MAIMIKCSFRTKIFLSYKNLPFAKGTFLSLFSYTQECACSGFSILPLVGNIFTICTNLITNGNIGKEIGANGTKGTMGVLDLEILRAIGLLRAAR